ncbi:MAG: hypothetical protein AB4352_14645 [Hormoscilla sp.]
MSNSSNTLLALLVTLPDLDPPLTASEQDSLKEVANQMSMDPDSWESDIEPELLDIVEANPGWSKLFAATKSKLDSMNIPQELIPTPEEIALAFPSDEAPAERGFEPEGDSDDDELNSIHNISVSILAASNPQEVTKKAGFVDKIKAFIS